MNPMVAKKMLALDITSQFHGPEEGRQAQANFERVVQRRDLPDDIREYGFSTSPGGRAGITDGVAATSLSQLLAAAGLAASNSEAKRLLNEGAIELVRGSGEPLKLPAGYAVGSLQPGDVLKRGGRQFVRLVEG